MCSFSSPAGAHYHTKTASFTVAVIYRGVPSGLHPATVRTSVSTVVQQSRSTAVLCGVIFSVPVIRETDTEAGGDKVTKESFASVARCFSITDRLTD